MPRPLLPIALLYVAGILAGRFVSAPCWLLLALALTLALLALFWDRARLALLYPVLVLTGWANLAFHTAVLSPNDLRTVLGAEPQIVTVRGTLRDTPSLRVIERGEEEAWRTMAQIDVTALCPNRRAWRPAFGRIAVTTRGALTNLFAGQTVEVMGVAAPPKGAVAEGTFDYRAYLSELGIHYHLQAASEQDWTILSSPSPPLADRFRSWARQALARGLPVEDESLRLEWALTLGWKTALTEEVSEPFVRAATYHIFAVDGLRMAIIFGIFFALFRAIGLPRPMIGLILLPLIWFYVGLTGWPASAIRATVMLSVVIVGWVLKRPSDLVNSLFAAALIILAWQPQQLFQAGFQLSFFVVLCIILTVSPLHHWLQRLIAPDPLLPAALHPGWRRTFRVPLNYSAELLVTSFAAWIGSLPLVALYFNIITPVSTPANIIAVPLCGLVLSSNLAGLLLAGWFPAAAELFNHAGWFLMECIRVSSHWFADWPGAFAYVPAPNLFTSALYYAILLAVVTGWLFEPRLRAVKFAALTCLLATWGWQFWRENSLTRITILPLNGGMALYFDAPGLSDDLLSDCGATNSVAFTTKPFLRAQGVNRLPRLVLTHGDIRHTGGAQLAAELFSAKQVCASPIRFRSPSYRKAIDAFAQTPEKLQRLECGAQLGSWTVVHPGPSDRFPQADDNALVLAGTVRGTKFLLLSDLGRLGQDALLARSPDLRADIVVTGLPSGSEALSDGLLDVIHPRLIIIADSEFPASERASPKLRQRLAERNIPVICTRYAGAVTLDLRAGQCELRAMNGVRLARAFDAPVVLPPPGQSVSESPDDGS